MTRSVLASRPRSRRTWLALMIGCVGFALAAVVPAMAVLPDEMLKDPALESRARAISSELRCLVCRNQSIDDSDADLARDLRLLVRERLTAGDSDEAIRDYLVARYGEFVLLRPRFETGTLILWLSGPAVLILGGLAILAARRNTRRTAEPELTAEEQARVEALLARETGNG